MVTQPSSCSRSATLYCTIELHQFVLRHVRSSVLAERCDRRWHHQPSCYVCHYWGIPPLLRSSSPSPRGRALLYGSAATAMVSSKSAFSSATSSRSAATSLSVAAAAPPDAASSLPVTALLEGGGGGGASAPWKLVPSACSLRRLAALFCALRLIVRVLVHFFRHYSKGGSVDCRFQQL